MKNSFDNYLDKISSIKDENKRITYSSLVSSLPSLLMLKKLLIRKNQGKKPFDKNFEYEKKIGTIDETFSYIESMLVKKDFFDAKEKKALNDCSLIASLAVDNVKMESLKADFRWISQEIKDISESLSQFEAIRLSFFYSLQSARSQGFLLLKKYLTLFSMKPAIK